MVTSTISLANHLDKGPPQTDQDIQGVPAATRVHRPPHHILLDPRATNTLDLDRHLALRDTHLALQDTHLALTKVTPDPTVNDHKRDIRVKDLHTLDKDQVDHNLAAILTQEATQGKDKITLVNQGQNLAGQVHQDLDPVAIQVVLTLLATETQAAAQAVLVSLVQDLDLEVLEVPAAPQVQAVRFTLAQDLQVSVDPMITELMKMVTTQPFLENLTWITRSLQKYQKPHLDAMLNRILAITLMLRLVAKCSMFAPITEPMTSSALMEQFSLSKSLYASGGTNSTATVPLVFTN